MVVALHATIHDSSVSLLSDPLSCCVDVDPIRISPHIWIYLPKLYWGARVIQYRLFKGYVEVAIIEEDVWIMEPPIEVSLHGLDRLHHSFQLLISCQHNQSCVSTWSDSLGLEAAGHENFVMILTYFPEAKSATTWNPCNFIIIGPTV